MRNVNENYIYKYNQNLMIKKLLDKMKIIK